MQQMHTETHTKKNRKFHRSFDRFHNKHENIGHQQINSHKKRKLIKLNDAANQLDRILNRTSFLTEQVSMGGMMKQMNKSPVFVETLTNLS